MSEPLQITDFHVINRLVLEAMTGRSRVREWYHRVSKGVRDLKAETRSPRLHADADRVLAGFEAAASLFENLLADVDRGATRP